ncbi:MAG: SIS domain-containing protein [Alphaproteobacteria bacterium]|nr:SIS domain-containing protein [Alphaproteobacteria bacterium]
MRESSTALMARDIELQPKILKQIADGLVTEAQAVRADRSRPLWVGGCGDSLFAAEALSTAFRSQGWDVRPVSSAEILWEAPIRAGDGVVLISISGTTRRTVEAMRRAAGHGAFTIAITLDPKSPLAKSAAHALTLPYEPLSRQIPHGLDYTVTLLALACLAGPVNGMGIAEQIDESLPAALQGGRRIANALPKAARFFFLGCGAAVGSARYGAAKMQEAGGIAAWALEAENMTHGANFMMVPGDHAILVGSGGGGDARTAALEPGLKALGLSVSKTALSSASGGPIERAFIAALHAQTLCLAVAEKRRLDVTDPGRGSKAATIQKDWFSWSSGESS